MGNSHSVLSSGDVGHARSRNKLSKPKIGNHQKSSITARTNSKTGHSAGALKNRGQVRERIYSDIFEHGKVPPLKPDLCTARCTSQSIPHDGSTTQHSWHRWSLNSAGSNGLQLPAAIRDGEQMGPNVLRTRSHSSINVKRRKSQLIAPPPATATRKLSDSEPVSHSLVPELVRFAALDLANTTRVQTPSAYSTIGAFERGSLRVVNGTASPSPDSAENIEIPYEHTHLGGNVIEFEPISYSSRTGASSDTSKELSANSIAKKDIAFALRSHEQLLPIHQFPTSWPSFEPPTIGALPTQPSPKMPYISRPLEGPLDSTPTLDRHIQALPYPSPAQDRQTIPHISNFANPTRPRSLYTNSVVDVHYTQSNCCECESRDSRRPSIRSGSDSGYSSSRSIISWKSLSGRSSESNLSYLGTGTENGRKYTSSREPSLKGGEGTLKCSFLQGQTALCEEHHPRIRRPLNRRSSYRGLDNSANKASMLSVTHSGSHSHRKLQTVASNNHLEPPDHDLHDSTRLQNSSASYQTSWPLAIHGVSKVTSYSDDHLNSTAAFLLSKQISKQSSISYPDTEYYTRFRDRRNALEKLCGEIPPHHATSGLPP